jgi:AcrR family transcriptional regulator
MPGRKAPEETRREDILRAAYDVAARQGVEALTVRAVAARAELSHGTVLFHFRRRDELVATLLDQVLAATAELQAPDAAAGDLSGAERLHMLLRSEMERLSADPRHFRLFLEYWTLGVRNPSIRRKVSAALGRYRGALRRFAEPIANADGVASVAVSLIHGCALQAVIDPKEFDVHQHFAVAGRMLDRFAVGSAGSMSFSAPAARPA